MMPDLRGLEPVRGEFCLFIHLPQMKNAALRGNARTPPYGSIGMRMRSGRQEISCEKSGMIPEAGNFTSWLPRTRAHLPAAGGAHVACAWYPPSQSARRTG